MTEKFTYDVFISYSSQDKAIVHPLAQRLKLDGVKVWLDDWVLQPGDPISLKIQQGLEKSRVLLMCISKAYFASNWTKLEHHTLLFRDPTNEQRRFVPLLVEDCERPDVIAQFLHIDWREKEERAYQRLLASCSLLPIDVERILKPEPAKGKAVPIETIGRHHGNVYGFSISQHGAYAVSCSADHSIKLWNIDHRYVVATLEGHTRAVRCVAITSDGERAISGSDDATLKVWDLKNQELIGTLCGHKETIYSVSFMKADRHAISVSGDGSLKIWDIDQQSEIETLAVSSKPVTCLAITVDGRTVLTGSDDHIIRIWNLNEQSFEEIPSSHTGSICSIDIAPDNSFAASCSHDGTIKIWDFVRGYNIATFEGHHGAVTDVAISSDSQRLASSSSDGTINIWDVAKQSLLASLGGHAHKNQNFYASRESKLLLAIAISPDDHLLISGNSRGDIDFWDFTQFKDASPSKITSRYTNAKVVLVGESGVGKSGLALRLAENDWRETGSTHGTSVTKLDLPNDPAVPAEREVWLWDFAGQPDYRLIHQLYMDETALALMVIDPQKDEPFAPLGHWERALSRAVRQ
ncbi:MAG: TIR domain-containing protein [Rhizobiales bacterium]|nr:TIR domain-containing protein [Hyphomicrobiales bacterium]